MATEPSFIGREREIAEAKRQFAETHLLTLTGPGGAGKTRLSLQIAAELVDAFDDGVWFVDLAPINDPSLVVPAIGHVLRLSDSPGTPMLEVLRDYLHERELLLVLDNFEQLVEAAPLLKTLLTSAPKLKMLVTSRTLLRIAGEREYAVPLLALPDPSHLPPLDQLTHYEAVRLFIERARSVKSDFVVTNESAPSVAEICYRLDGLPLAIELAAARVRLLPPQKMLSQLNHKLKILVSAARDLPPRQQTLRGAINWSFGLLALTEQMLFRRLSVFPRGATPISDRPAGKQIAPMLKQRQADVVIIYQVDRLSRDIVDLLATVREWLRMGAQLYTSDMGQIHSELDIVLVIRGWQGSDERRKIVERTTRGRDAKAKAGKVVGTGKAPYGYSYTYDDGKVCGLAIVEDEAKIVSQIYQWYVQGDENGKPLTAYAIAYRLSELRIQTPDKRKGTRKREPHMWNELTVNRILKDEKYAGVGRFRKTIGTAGKVGKRPLGEQFVVSVPAIVDHELWQAAQQQRDYNKRMSKRNAKRDYLLRGIGTCGECGGRLFGGIRGPNRYYGCGSVSQHFGKLEPVCKQRRVRAEQLEAVVSDYILDLWSNRERFVSALRDAQQAEQLATQPKRERLSHVLALIQDCGREADEIAAAMKKAHGLVSQRLERDMTELEKRHAALTKERDELQASLSTNKLTDEAIAAALQDRENVLVAMQDPTAEGQRRTLELLQVGVVVQDGQARVSCRVSTSVLFDLCCARSTCPVQSIPPPARR